jgi:hypothetical protein
MECEEGGSMSLRNVEILHHYTPLQSTRQLMLPLNKVLNMKSLHPEDGGSKVLRNVGILPHHYTMSDCRRPRLGTYTFFE